MKILQLIDTLHVGGAERVALNYANSLPNYGIESHICITREKGVLYDDLNTGVKVHFLNKKSTFDILALNRLSNIIKKNNIDIVHAHGTSWFFAVVSKIAGGNFKLIWHDHYGNSEFLHSREAWFLGVFSKNFNGIITVNEKLAEWAKKKLHCRRVIFLNNFINRKEQNSERQFLLKGDAKSKFICVANLRPQKDHHTLLKAFNLVKNQNKEVSLHLFGKDFKDEYSRSLIQQFESTSSVFWYGEDNNIPSYLMEADIGVLSSLSEGLPLVLLEYAQAGLGVICTDVGECRNVIGDDAIIVRPDNPDDLAYGMKVYLQDNKKLKKDSSALTSRVDKLYSENHVIPQYLKFCKAL